MARKKGLKKYTRDELVAELAHRDAESEYRDGMTMDDLERIAEKIKGETAEKSLRAMLSRIPPEKPGGKACPRCGKRIPVKALARERTVRTLSGPVTFKRNYHYCEDCKYGFYPMDYLLGLPEEGELTNEMAKRVLDFAINDVYGQGAQRWAVHYPDQPISDNLLRRVAARIGNQCEAVEHGRLQEELKPPKERAAEVLVVETDGSMLPIRGIEPWKEAKVGVVYRHDVAAQAPAPDSARYVAVIGGMGEFAPALEETLDVEKIDDCATVVWLGDGAPSNWRLADQLAPDAVQILDSHHAIENAMTCARVVLGEEDPYLPLWQQRVEKLLGDGEPDKLVAELLDCKASLDKRRRDRAAAQAAIDTLVGYYNANLDRMEYAYFRAQKYPIGTGAVESAHRHVLQTRMKRAGQHWALRNARKMARLRAAFRTAGASTLYSAIRRAWETRHSARVRGRKQTFRYARQGRRDLDNMERIRASN